MMMSWWLWMALMLVFLVPPVGYGWGYRGWGPPYPRYIQRRRGEQSAAYAVGSRDFNHQSWGWGGDFVWMVLFVGLFWAMMGVLWR